MIGLNLCAPVYAGVYAYARRMTYFTWTRFLHHARAPRLFPRDRYVDKPVRWFLREMIWRTTPQRLALFFVVFICVVYTYLNVTSVSKRLVQTNWRYSPSKYQIRQTWQCWRVGTRFLHLYPKLLRNARRERSHSVTHCDRINRWKCQIWPLSTRLHPGTNSREWFLRESEVRSFLET